MKNPPAGRNLLWFLRFGKFWLQNTNKWPPILNFLAILFVNTQTNGPRILRFLNILFVNTNIILGYLKTLFAIHNQESEVGKSFVWNTNTIESLGYLVCETQGIEVKGFTWASSRSHGPSVCLWNTNKNSTYWNCVCETQTKISKFHENLTISQKVVYQTYENPGIPYFQKRCVPNLRKFRRRDLG